MDWKGISVEQLNVKEGLTFLKIHCHMAHKAFSAIPLLGKSTGETDPLMLCLYGKTT
jgi:hypothetical protein